MRAIEAMIVWTPADDVRAGSTYEATAGKATVVPWPDYGGRGEDYRMSVGACFSEFRDMTDHRRLAQIFIDFQTMVVRDGIQPAVAHAAFLNIEEYAEAISPDIQGARDKEPHYVGITQDRPDNFVADLKALPSIESATAEILHAQDITGGGWILAMLRDALLADANGESPVHRNVQALKLAIDLEGTTFGSATVEARWQSIHEAFRNA